MKLFLITKEDWGNASIGTKLFNVIFNVVSLLVLVLTILEFLDWIGLIS